MAADRTSRGGGLVYVALVAGLLAAAIAGVMATTIAASRNGFTPIESGTPHLAGS
jgi:hypothetical protein